MRGQKLVMHGLAVAMLTAGTMAYADAPAAKWYDTIGVSGYLQASYVGNLNKPADGEKAGNTGAKLPNVGRQFDTDSNGFNLNTFLLQIAKPVGDSDHYGFTARLRTGQDAQTLGGSSLFVQEAYATYAVPSTKLQLIGGKFVTPEGFEGVDTVNNPNFSEGLLFTFAEPVTHTGIKANYAFSDKINATVGLVNGWDVNNPDNNTAKTILFQVATTPTKQITWNFQGLYGKELNDPSSSERLSLDTVLGFNLDKLSLNGQLNWGQQSNDPSTIAYSGTKAGTSHWEGAGLWASYALSSMFTEIARFEVLGDQNGAARFFAGTAPGAAPFADGTANQTVKEFTLTHKTMLTSAMGTRLEWRHDWSNQAWFVKHDGSAVKDQNTLSVDWFVTF